MAKSVTSSGPAMILFSTQEKNRNRSGRNKEDKNGGEAKRSRKR